MTDRPYATVPDPPPTSHPRGGSAADDRDTDGAHRDRLAELRDLAGDTRDLRARARDALADERDDLGAHRDRAAAERDRTAEQQDEESPIWGTGRRERALAARRAAADDRLQARQDRKAGAAARALTRTDRDTSSVDRSASARERSGAHRDRLWSADERRSSALDALTGVSSRGAGTVQLEQEIERSHREGRSLVLAFVDADRLKETNDALGHAAGDRLLARLAATLRRRQRSYDVVMRFGGDEFVCAMPDVSLATAAARLQDAAAAFAADGGGFTFGLAELRPGDTASSLIARADLAFYARRYDRPTE